MMKIIRTKNYDEMSEKVAELIAKEIRENEHPVIGLATGSTPIGAYKKLIQWYEEGNLDFSDVTTVNLDEYKGLPRENEQSYWYFMHDNLFDHVNIRPDHVNLPDGMNDDPEAECARYDQVVASTGGVHIQLLGMGHNGHIAFNEPSDSFTRGTNCVALQQSTIDANKRFFESEADVPRYAYTMGIGTIMAAKKIVIAVNGRAKAETVKAAFTGPVTPRVPASILQFHPEVYVVLDEEAASLL
jgi:glucosamine-6-phosphate deaminase